MQHTTITTMIIMIHHVAKI